MKKILLTLCIFVTTSCTSVSGHLVSEKKEGWFNGIRRSDIGPGSPFSFLNPFVQRGFMYCKANDKNESGLADPVCYRVRYSTYSEEKSGYVEKASSNESSVKINLSQDSLAQKDSENSLISGEQKSKDSKKTKAKR
jgi:hypothetical protein